MNRPVWRLLGLSILFAAALPAATVTVDASFNATVFGNRNDGGQLTNHLFETGTTGSVINNVIRNQPMVLNGSAVPVSFSDGGYIALVNGGVQLTSASLDIVLATSTNIVASLRPPTTQFFTPTYTATLATLNVTVTVGTVSRTYAVTPTSFTLNLDSALLTQMNAGKPMQISFNGTENFSANVTGYDGKTLNGRQILNLSDTRTLGSAFGTGMTVYYEVPEPLPTVLVGAGLMLIGCFRWKRRR